MRNRRWLEKEPLTPKKMAQTADAPRRLEKKLVAAAIHAALAGVLAMTPFAQGSDLPDTSVFANAREVSDDILGDTRGKFVSGGRVVRFGIEMTSKWESRGNALEAAANLHVEMSRSASRPDVTFTPRFTVADDSDSVPTPGSATRTVDAGNGISRVSGVAQSIQVAGDGVSAANNAVVQIEIGPGTGSDSSDLPVPAAASQAQTTASGAALSASVGAEGLRVSITVPGVGEIKQQIMGAAGGGGGLAQTVTIAGDAVRVHNATVLRIEMARPDGLSMGNVSAALSNLRGVRPMGVF